MKVFNISIEISELQLTLHPNLRTILRSPFFEQLKPSSSADGVAIVLFLFSVLGYPTRGRVWDKSDPHYEVYSERPQLLNDASSSKTAITRNVAQHLEDGNYQAVVFWGSQSGTAERFAESLGYECSTRFGINILVADLSDYDAATISEISTKHFAIFILSTYGEGDPSDNASGLCDCYKRTKDQQRKTESLRYLAFGLGSSNYKYYNHVLDMLVGALEAAGSTALIPPQRADDAESAAEEYLQSWKDDVFALFRSMGCEQRDVT